jgi:hypothetical protein
MLLAPLRYLRTLASEKPIFCVISGKDRVKFCRRDTKGHLSSLVCFAPYQPIRLAHTQTQTQTHIAYNTRRPTLLCTNERGRRAVYVTPKIKRSPPSKVVPREIYWSFVSLLLSFSSVEWLRVGGDWFWRPIVPDVTNRNLKIELLVNKTGLPF